MSAEARPFATTLRQLLLRTLPARGELAEISGFSYRARSLWCKRQIGRPTARREDAGDSSRHGEDFRGTEAAACAGVTSPLRGFARANSSSSRRRIRASARTSRCLFPMVLKYSSFGKPVQPLSGTSPAGWAGADAATFGVTPDSRIATRESVWVQADPQPPPFAPR